MSSAPAFPSLALSSSASASVLMVVITVVGILAAFALLASYYAFVTRCQLLRAVLSRNPPWRGGREPSMTLRAAAPSEEQQRHRGLGLPLICMLPVVKFMAGEERRRVSVSSECAVCLSEFMDTWLQGSARCPFCRRSVTMPPPLMPPLHGHNDDRPRQDDLCAFPTRI